MPPDTTVFQTWLDSLRLSDSKLYEELKTRLNERVVQHEDAKLTDRVTRESVGDQRPVRDRMLEAIVREGRPAIPIVENRVSFAGAVMDAAAETIVDRLKVAAPIVEPYLPLVGRIDVENYAGSLSYVGTGWLVDSNIAVTNRHVAELIARSDENSFRFRPGRFGEALRVSIDYRHELGTMATSVVRVVRVIWIEPDSQGPDIAFLELDQQNNGTTRSFIPLAKTDSPPGTEVAVIGYPARAPAHIIPDQKWMDEIYGGAYDIKRIAPGLVGAKSKGWATHDCTTLGGNSGSVVVDMKTGEAVALHFAGQFMIENYCVPASIINRYQNERPWHGANVTKRSDQNGSNERSESKTTSTAQVTTTKINPKLSSHGISFTVPLTITISVGEPSIASDDDGAAVQELGTNFQSAEEAAREFQRRYSSEGFYSVWPGYEIKNGRLSDIDCIVVSVHPDRVDQIRGRLPQTFGGYPVDLRDASIREIVEASGLLEEAPTSISYNDDERQGEAFSFDWVNENMSVVLHVGPERSWTELAKFFQQANHELVSSMYEFHAAHIASAVERPLTDGVSLQLVLARQTRDPRNNKIPNGDFDRSETFERWAQIFKNKFDRIFVPLGANGLVAMSYHIKVTVADGSKIWLSSGNWKRSSQPLIPINSLEDPKVTSKAGNREWHVVMENETLAKRFRNHIKADFERSLELGGTEEAVELETLIDVPAPIAFESIELEGPASRVLEPLSIKRRVRVKPLLTPDKEGAVYSEAVLQLIQSAEVQLLFQNQYISMKGSDGGFFKRLVDALAEKARKLEDFRIILRRENDSLQFDLSQLKRRGIDVKRQVRLLSNTHTKGIIVDGKQVLIGSHNWSSLGVTLNRDASLIFDDSEIAQYYTEAFNIDWDRANEPRFAERSAENVRPAEGSEPPSGYVRMTLSDYLEG